MRKCPYCAELIRIEAIKCRYCASDLNIAAAAAGINEPAGQRPSDG